MATLDPLSKREELAMNFACGMMTPANRDQSNKPAIDKGFDMADYFIKKSKEG